jgi:hypothetical protein
MKIKMKSPQGSELELEFSSAGLSPDGMDTRLRQVVDTYSAMVRTDFETGAALSATLDDADIDVDLDADE